MHKNVNIIITHVHAFILPVSSSPPSSAPLLSNIVFEWTLIEVKAFHVRSYARYQYSNHRRIIVALDVSHQCHLIRMDARASEGRDGERAGEVVGLGDDAAKRKEERDRDGDGQKENEARRNIGAK